MFPLFVDFHTALEPIIPRFTSHFPDPGSARQLLRPMGRVEVRVEVRAEGQKPLAGPGGGRMSPFHKEVRPWIPDLLRLTNSPWRLDQERIRPVDHLGLSFYDKGRVRRIQVES